MNFKYSSYIYIKMERKVEESKGEEKKKSGNKRRGKEKSHMNRKGDERK